MKLYYLYKIFSWDLLFYYAISFLYLNSYHGLSAAEIIFADAYKAELLPSIFENDFDLFLLGGRES